MTRTLFNALSIIKVFGASLVMTTHYAGEFFGVSFYSYGTGCFFVVAGYYALNWERSQGMYYLLKRLLRLYPAFLVATVAYLLCSGLPASEWPVLLGHHALFLLTVSDRETAFALNPPFWSLPVFFTFFALIAFLPRLRPRLWHVLVLMLCAALTVQMNLTHWREGYIELLAFPLHLYAFWLGGWLGCVTHFSETLKKHRYTLLAGALMALIVRVEYCISR